MSRKRQNKYGRPRFPWGDSGVRVGDLGTVKQVRNLLRVNKVSLPEVIGPATTLRGRELYWRLRAVFPECCHTLELMGAEKGLI